MIRNINFPGYPCYRGQGFFLIHLFLLLLNGLLIRIGINTTTGELADPLICPEEFSATTDFQAYWGCDDWEHCED